MFVAPKSPANGPEWWRFFHELRSYFLASDVWESAGRSHSILHSLKGQLDSFTLYPGGGGI